MRLVAFSLAAVSLLAGPTTAQEVRYLPGVANATGQNDTRFESRVTIVNLGAADGTVQIGFLPPLGQAAPGAVTRTLRAGETLALRNALAELFGLSGTFGTLAVRSALPLDVSGSTANVKDPAATYGLGLVSLGVAGLLHPGETGHIAWVSHSGDPSSGFRTNVAVVLAEAGTSVQLTVYDEAGFFRGTRRVTSEAPGTWQASLVEIASNPAIEVGRVELRVLSGAATGYAAVVDNLTGDGIAALAERAGTGASDLLLDGVARTPGAGGTLWRTDLRLANPTTSPLPVALAGVGFATPASSTLTLPPAGTLEVADVLGRMGLPDGVAGALRLTASGPLLAAASTRNRDPGGRPGTFSAFQRAVPFASGPVPAGGAATLSGLVVSGFRTNLAFLAPSSAASATLALRDAAGAALATGAVSLAAGAWTQRSLAGWFPSFSSALPENARVELVVSASGGPLDAYASRIDESTGDAVVLAPTRAPTGACAPPTLAGFTASPPSIDLGGSASLTLQASAPARVFPGDLPLAPGGSLTVTPTLTTTYRAVVAGGCAPDAEATATVVVSPVSGTALPEQGAVRGVQEGTSWVYRGLRAIAPPLGALRLRPPVSAPAHEGVMEARSFGSVCLQFDEDGRLEGAEDCVFLNVFRPATATAGLPVFVWIHGGGNVQGSGSESLYDGKALAASGLVVVTVNYRLSALGYLAHPALGAESARGVSGNYGVLDLVATLGWIQRNAEAFGGDPSRVTIAGESAGAVNVCALMASPLARGLFHRAVMESGGCYQQPLSAFETFGKTIVSKTSCAGATDAALPACLRALTAEALTSAVPGQANVVSSSGQLYGPNVDGFVLLRSPYDALRTGEFTHVPFLVGANSDETSIFAPPLATAAAYQLYVLAEFGPALGAAILRQYPASAYPTPQKAYIALTSDYRFICGARRFASAAAGAFRPDGPGGVAFGAAGSQSDSPVFRYHFTKSMDSGPNAGAGAFHGLEIPFVFGNISSPLYRPSELEKALSAAMLGYWSRFAASGDPNGAGAVAWPRYDVATDPYLELGNTIAPGAAVRKAECDFWDVLASGL